MTARAWIKSPGGTRREAPGGPQPPVKGRGAAAARGDPGILSSSPPRAWPWLYLPHTASHPAGRTELFISSPAFPRCASLQRRVLCKQQLINLCSPPCARGGFRSSPVFQGEKAESGTRSEAGVPLSNTSLRAARGARRSSASSGLGFFGISAGPDCVLQAARLPGWDLLGSG